MKNKITSSPWGFRFFEFADYCKFMKSIGINQICGMFGDGFPLSIRKTEKDIEECLIIAEGVGVSFVEVATTGLDFEIELPLAAKLGVKYFRVCDIWEDSETTFNEVTSILKKMGDAAKEFDITVIVENHGGLLAKTANCKRFFEKINNNNVGLNYDPANFLYYGEEPIEAYKQLNTFIKFVHLKNVKYVDNKPQYCRIKDGEINYALLLDLILPEYKGFLCLEYEDENDVKDGTKDDFDFLS